MKLIVKLFIFPILLSSYSVYSLKIPFSRREPRGISVKSPFAVSRYSFAPSSVQETVNNVQDIRYTVNITINHVQVQVALDTGSTDLWVIPPGGVGKFNDTGLPLGLFYGDGTYGTTGTIGVAPFRLGSYRIQKQAFLNAITSNISALQEIGVYGLLGLSFDFSSVSPINQKIKSVYGPNATWGQSVLQNIFDQNPTEPNFIAIDLSRSEDMEDTDGGSFTIGEYDPKYAAVAEKPQLAQYPKGGDRWSTILDGVSVNNRSIDVVSTVAGVPAGKSTALLDTGDLNGIFPVAMYDAIYSQIPGSVLLDDACEGVHVWIVPCNTTSIVEITFCGERYPIHPLDLTTINDPVTINGKEWVSCGAAFKGLDGWGEDAFDISLGDSFLRNVYSVFDFGDNFPNCSASDPYMQLLSQVDPDQAVAEVITFRGRTMAKLPPEIDPATLVAFLKANETSADCAQTSSGIFSATATSSTRIPDASATRKH